MASTVVTRVLATVKGAKEPWAVITDEPPTLQTLWQYALRFRVEELFLDSKSGAFEERRFPFALRTGTGTVVSRRGCRDPVCYDPGYGSTNCWSAATS
jgi:hypothetical protein